MARPERPLDTRTGYDRARTFFVTWRTAGSRSLFQTERMANLLIEVLREHTLSGKFKVHDFVIMPNHIHVLLSLPGNLSVERAVQLIKGGFSFRAKKELGFAGEVWQKGFSEVGVRRRKSFLELRRYIENNPVKAGLVNAPEEYRYGSSYLKHNKSAGAEARAGQ